MPNNFKLLHGSDYKPPEIENDHPDDSEGDEVADAPDRHGLAAWGLGERHQPKASADNQPQTLGD